LRCFFDDDFFKLSLKKVIETLTKIRQSFILPLINAGLSPINIHIECHSVGGISVSEQDFERHLVEPWRIEEINVMDEPAFYNYRAFPSM